MPVFEPAQEPAQLGPQDAFVRQAAEEGLDGIQHYAYGAPAADRKIEAHEQALEIVLAGLLDLAAIDVDVIDGELPLRDQCRQIEPERGHVAGEVAGALLEADEHAGLVAVPRAVHEEAQPHQRLAGARPSAHERRTPSGQPAPGDLVQAADTARGFLELALKGL